MLVESRVPRSGRSSILWLCAWMLALLWLLLSATPAAAQTIYYAKPDGNPEQSGGSWFSATTLQKALEKAQAGDQIWVARGVYLPGNTVGSTFQLKPDVAIYGGFDGGFDDNALAEGVEDRQWQVNVTVLSGDIDDNDTFKTANGVVTNTEGIKGANAYHVVTGSGTGSTTLLDGVTITAGSASGSLSDPCDETCGGGMYNVGGSPTLVNVTFAGNLAAGEGGLEAAGYGGGMYNSNSSPSLTGVIFSGNRAQIGGGGMHNRANSSPTFTGVTFTGNHASLHGGGMHNIEDSNPILSNVTFSNNRSNKNGGGMVNDESNPILANVIFTGNRAQYGGAMRTTRRVPR
jgi:hypothetical protein